MMGMFPNYNANRLGGNASQSGGGLGGIIGSLGSGRSSTRPNAFTPGWSEQKPPLGSVPGVPENTTWRDGNYPVNLKTLTPNAQGLYSGNGRLPGVSAHGGTLPLPSPTLGGSGAGAMTQQYDPYIWTAANGTRYWRSSNPGGIGGAVLIPVDKPATSNQMAPGWEGNTGTPQHFAGSQITQAATGQPVPAGQTYPSGPNTRTLAPNGRLLSQYPGQTNPDPIPGLQPVDAWGNQVGGTHQVGTWQPGDALAPGQSGTDYGRNVPNMPYATGPGYNGPITGNGATWNGQTQSWSQPAQTPAQPPIQPIDSNAAGAISSALGGSGTQNPNAWLFNAGPGTSWDGVDHTNEWSGQQPKSVGQDFYNNIYKYNSFTPQNAAQLDPSYGTQPAQAPALTPEQKAFNDAAYQRWANPHAYSTSAGASSQNGKPFVAPYRPIAAPQPMIPSMTPTPQQAWQSNYAPMY